MSITLNQQTTANNLAAFLKVSNIIQYLTSEAVINLDAVAKMTFLRTKLVSEMPTSEWKIARQMVATMHPYVGDGTTRVAPVRSAADQAAINLGKDLNQCFNEVTCAECGAVFPATPLFAPPASRHTCKPCDAPGYLDERLAALDEDRKAQGHFTSAEEEALYKRACFNKAADKVINQLLEQSGIAL